LNSPAHIAVWQYHKKGMECIYNMMGEPLKNDGFASVRRWHRDVKYELDPPRLEGQSLCDYLANNTEEVGMRAYIDYIFHSQYVTLMTIWALAREVPFFAERTLTICYEELMSNPDEARTVQGILDFLYNRTSTYDQAKSTTTYRAEATPGSPSASQRPREYSGAHATSHDQALRDRLIGVIRRIDAEHYNGDIAWLDSVLPC